MHFLVMLFWIGLLITFALAVFNLMVTFGLALLVGIGAGFAWIFKKLHLHN